MSSTESDQFDAVDHWNRAVDAEDAEDFETAIEEYDACLCSAPNAEIALEAFYRLGFVINRAYDLNDGNYDEEQLEWRYCELACCEQVVRIYEAHPDFWSQCSEIKADEIYFEVQAVLQKPFVSSETSAGDVETESYVTEAKELQLLRCFSDEIQFSFDADGEALSDESSIKSNHKALISYLKTVFIPSQAIDPQENPQPAPNPPKEQVMEEGLTGKMCSLVGRLNLLIGEYEATVEKLTKKFESSLQSAKTEAKKVETDFEVEKNRIDSVRREAIDHGKVLLATGKSHVSSAINHLHTQSVFQPSASHAVGEYTDKKNPIGSAEEAIKHAGEALDKLQNTNKPTDHKGVFLGFGIVGFVISICAAANSRRGDGGSMFVLVNALFLGAAAVIAVVRNSFATSEMKTLYGVIERETSEAAAYIAGAKKLIESQHESSLAAATKTYYLARERCESKKKEINTQHETDLRNFKQEFAPRVNYFRKQVAEFHQETGFVGMSWADPTWETWTPATSPAFSACIGTLQSPRIQLLQPYFGGISLDFEIPALVPFADGVDGKCLLQKATGRAKEACVGATQSMMLRLLANVPPGRVLFTLLDPVGLGQSAAPFMSLADHEEKLITNRAWSEPQHIDEQLSKLTEHMENVIQKYLRNDYPSIEKYNEKAEVPEPYRVLVVFDFPVNFSETAARRLVSIAKNGPRCGVYTLIVMDTDPSKKLPYGFNLADLESAANVIHFGKDRFVWDESQFARYEVSLDSPANEDRFKHIVKETGTRAPESMRVEVPFDKLLAKANITPDTFWTGSTSQKIHVPLGPQGAKKLQYLTLGTGTEHHVVCIGMPGSGKTNLMHIIITTMGLMYSPREMQLYLVDFKQGVGFKRYAENSLPHAKVIAIDSEREFGLSVLQKLDRELNERGEKFRAAGVDAISDYRQKQPNAFMPRILLVVDEFQEFFSHDDNIGTQAGLLLDRLVRQGRYAGIHVMLGSQSLANRSSLPTSTLGQIGIRIALKCGESDARLIMGDGNLQARLLSRPGEAIYNSANGLLEGNNFFQVARFFDEDGNKSLAEIRRYAKQAQGLNGAFETPVVFEGNAPARFEECKPLKEMLAAESRTERLKGASAWLGEPIAIRPPTTARFRRQGGSNLIIVTRDEEEGVGVAISALVALFAQYGPDAAKFVIFNLTTADSDWNELPTNLGQAFPHDIQIVGRRNIREVLNELVKEANQRIEDQSSNNPEIFFVILGLHRARDLREEDDGLSRFSTSKKADDLDPHEAFLTLLREGPESGIHVITWCDAYAGIARIDRRILGEFSMRVAGAMSNEDSGRLIDDSLASKLDKAHRAVFYDEERPGQLEKFRPYSIPDWNWIESFASRVWPRSNKA